MARATTRSSGPSRARRRDRVDRPGAAPHRLSASLTSAALTAIRAASAIAARLPPHLARRAAEASGVAVSKLPAAPGRPGAWSRRRELLARHLTRVYGQELDPKELRGMVDDAIASYAHYWADNLRLPRLSTSQIDAGMSYKGFEHIEGGLATGRGVILALPHLGGWEWAGTHLVNLGLQVSVVVERLGRPDIFEWFVSFRTRLGMNVIPMGPGAAARCAQALRDNHVLCLLSDRLIGDTSSVEVAFFGEKTRLPAGPATLALRTGAHLVPTAVYFEPRTDGHVGFLLPPLDTQRSTERSLRGDVGHLTRLLAGGFEDLIRRAPTQWHMMQPNWPSDHDPSGLLTGLVH
ncbi:MAG: phosphatidylinositol mannoside acyltransferase [Acidimicrobiales bacterium]|nr:phosphatidylinositol mannoside acyltransferase [Acidimicrobiales bacterium]